MRGPPQSDGGLQAIDRLDHASVEKCGRGKQPMSAVERRLQGEQPATLISLESLVEEPSRIEVGHQ
jgi:hypothetical protein